MNADGTGVRNITKHPAQDTSPSWQNSFLTAQMRSLAALVVLLILSSAACAGQPGAGEPRSFEATFRLNSSTEAVEEVPGPKSAPYLRVSRISFLEPGTWREDVLEESPVVSGGPGSYTIARPGRFFEYRAAANTYTATRGARRIRTTLAEFADLGSEEWRACERLGGGGKVAGRTTTHMRCPRGHGGGLPIPEPAPEAEPAPDPPPVSPGVEFWIDAETGLVLKSVAGLRPSGETLTATRIRYGPRFARKLFDQTPPPGARSSEEVEREAQREGSKTLSVGDEAPPWSAELLGGGRVDLGALRGRPTVVLFWASWCEPCTGDVLTGFDAEARARGGLHMVTVAYLDQATEVRRLVQKTGLSVSVALDEDGSLGKAWGLVGIPTYVFLDRDGRIVALHLEPLTAERLKEALGALAAGRPVRLD